MQGVERENVLNHSQKADPSPTSVGDEKASESKTDEKTEEDFYDAQSRKDVLLIHALSSAYCVPSKHPCYLSEL